MKSGSTIKVCAGRGLGSKWEMPAKGGLMPAKPKILCLTSYDLDGPDNGGTLRNRHLMRHLNNIGHVNVVLADDTANRLPIGKKFTGSFPLLDVIQFQPCNWKIADRMRNEFDRKFLNTDRLLALPEDSERLCRHAAEHDMIWIHTLKLANRFDRWRWPASVLDIDDIPSGVCKTSFTATNHPLEKLRHWRQAVLWQRREKLLPERFDAICVCSEADKKASGAKNIFILPNGFQMPAELPVRSPVNPPRFGFVGNFNHAPNRNGLEWFAEKIWPAILKKIPAARLRLAGSAAEIFQNLPNTDVLGWVADMENEMASWSLSVVPIRIGGGTRVKIAEAFSRKCPVVSTSVGAYGYEVVDGVELWMADSPEEFAKKCLQALENLPEATAMAERAWHKFLKNWTWEAQADRVAAVVETVLRSRPRKE